MTPGQFRSLALAMPEAVESGHMGHPDFRVRKRIFASLPDETTAVVKLPPEAQAALLATEPGVYEPAGGWGRHGWTRIRLAAADPADVHEVVVDAWGIVAPKGLVRAFEAAQGG